MPFSCLPRMIYPHLTDVTAEALRARGISFLMLDFDNTIVPIHDERARAARWPRGCGGMQASEIRLCVVSNSQQARAWWSSAGSTGWTASRMRKSRFPARHPRMSRRGFSLRSGARARCVGDQIYTDVLGRELPQGMTVDPGFGDSQSHHLAEAPACGGAAVYCNWNMEDTA